MRTTLPLLALFALPAAAAAQANAIVPDPDPEVERKSFVVAPGFEVNLFAADPLLAKPIQINFDPRGRLWVASSEVYPQIKPGEPANDKILILEDTDGDGKADKTTVFADGLLIPTGVEPGDGGAYVANSTELVHLSASKPGGKADRRRVVLSGFGTEDTHHILHTFRWGPDQALYFNQSIYIHSHVETPHGVKRLNGGGIWRFRPDTMDLSVFVRGFVNTWGHHFDRYGQSLITDGAYGEGVNHGVPGAYYVTAVGATRILPGLNPGSPKHCGLEVVSGRHLPDDWQGNVLTNDFRGHRVCRFVLRDNGSTFDSREVTEVIKSNHPAFRPIDVKMGPDGAIYIADWYNPIIQHGEVDFRDPRRDKTHGRIWRITAKGRPLVPRPKLADATVPELLEQLKSPEGWTRQQAKRVLKERGWEAVAQDLFTFENQLNPTDPGYERHLLESQWVRQAFDRFDAKSVMLAGALRAKSPQVRAAAVRIATDYFPQLKEVAVDLLARYATDQHPRVRLEAVRALALRKTVRSAEAALAALDMPMDRTLDYALWLTVRDLEPVWLPAFQKGEINFGNDPKKLAFALEASGSPEAVKPLVGLIDGGKLPADRAEELWLLLAKIGGPAELQKVLDRCADAGTATDRRNALVSAVETAARQRKVGMPPKPDALQTLAKSPDRPAARAAIHLIGLWKVERFRDAITAADDPEARFDALALFGDAKAKAALKAASADANPAVRRAAIAAYLTIDAPAAAAAAADFLTKAEPTPATGDLFAAFLRQKGGPAALAKALAGKTLPPDVAKVGLRAARAAGQPGVGLADAVTKAGNLSAPRKEPTADEVKSYVADVLKTGDPARGEAVYRRKEMQCLACHAIGGAGGQVGPDMTSIGASAQPDYLVESLLIPNKAVKEGYHAIEVNTLSGRVVSGVKLRESAKELVIRTAEDKEVAIPIDDIDTRKPARSLMPDALTDPLTRAEFADLVRFLSELGKVGPYSLSKARVVRRWQGIDPLAENMNALRRTRAAAAAETPDQFVWSPAYATVGGDLPLGEQPKIVIWRDTEPLSVVRFQLDVTAAGPVKLRFNSADGLTLYAGAAAVEAKAETVIDAKPGVQTITVVVERNKRAADLRCEVEDVPGSAARVAVVGGK